MRNVLILIAIILSSLAMSCSSDTAGTPFLLTPPVSGIETGMLGYSGDYVDVDGDGHLDLLVGAPATGGGRGAVLAYPGSASGIGNRASWVLLGQGRGDTLGYSVANIGDVDGDGADDFAVGALYAGGTSPKSGAVYVYRGGLDSPELLATLRGDLTLDMFGYSIAGGDLNDDGLSDVVVSAMYATGAAYQGGRVYIYFGGPAMDSSADAIINGHSANSGIGYGLETGDINDDGVDDLFVGGGHSVEIFYGASDLASKIAASDEPEVIINGSTGGGHSGHSFGDNILYLGDIDADGIGDLAVSNWRRSSPDAVDYIGSAYVFKGSDSYPAVVEVGDPAFKIANIVGLDRTQTFGTALALASDADSGGKPDLLVGSAWAQGGISNTTKATGKVYLFSTEDLLAGGGLYNTTHILNSYTVSSMSGEFGHVLSAGPYGDFFAGAPRLDLEKGGAFVINAATGAALEMAPGLNGGVE